MIHPRLLIVEHDPFIQFLLKETLEDERYTLLLASQGDEALQIVRQAKPEIILLDLSPWSRPSGYEVCRLLKADKETAHLRVILMSALGSEAERRMASAAGADHFVAKPFSPLGLLQKVEEYLDWEKPPPRPVNSASGWAS